MTDTILTKVVGGVATLTLNRPKEMNSFDGDTARAIIDAVEAFAADESVRTLVVASGGPVFCAGGDFNWVLSWPELDAITRKVGADSLMAAIQAVYDFPKPSIARVQGAAVGGGVGLMLACDFAVTVSSARFGLTSARNGLLAGIAIPVLIQAVGPRMARQLLMHGGMFDSATALRIGLVDQVVPHDELRAKTMELAAKIASFSPLTVRVAKESMRASERMAIEEGILYERDLFCLCFSTEDKKEGVEAFLAKRAPEWKGR